MNIREVLQEDETGSVEKSVMRLILEAKKKRRQVDRPVKVRLGIVSFLASNFSLKLHFKQVDDLSQQAVILAFKGNLFLKMNCTVLTNS